MSALRINGVSRSFGGVRAVDDVSFALEPATVTALIGPNGAGKSTLFNLIDGQLAPDAGSIEFEGRSLVDMPPLAGRATDAADHLLQQVGLGDRGDAPAAALAYGDLKRLEFALALAAGPRLLLMDEPTAGMAPGERTALMALVVAQVRERRMTVLFTEHSMDVVFGFAERVLVLSRGRLIADGGAAQVRANPEVQAIYLGSEE